MARSIRVEYEEAAYHVMARGNERKKIYQNDEDRKLFLETLEEAVRSNRVALHFTKVKCKATPVAGAC